MPQGSCLGKHFFIFFVIDLFNCIIICIYRPKDDRSNVIINGDDTVLRIVNKRQSVIRATLPDAVEMCSRVSYHIPNDS